jgi:cysteine desulfurase
MQRIYLDANATTPVLPAAVEAMLPYLGASFGNASSAHRSGQSARAAIERARESVATLLQAAAKELIFTSGGTESDNLALFGIVQQLQITEPTLRPHILTTAIEHHAVLHAAEELARRGADVTFLAPSHSGVVEAETFAQALRPETRLVSVMLANNETGAIQPVGKLARIAKEFAAQHGIRIAFHTDAVQAAGKLAIDLAGEFRNVDLLTVSGHKLYAPQGSGVLFVRSGTPISALSFGGPHERQRRAGTENVPAIVALGVAAGESVKWLRSEQPEALKSLRDRLEAGLLAALPGVAVNSTEAARMANTTNMRFDGVDAEALIMALDLAGIAASFGAACMSGVTEPSHVLLAAGLSAQDAKSSVRFSLSRFTTGEEIDRALAIIPATVERLRRIRHATTDTRGY